MKKYNLAFKSVASNDLQIKIEDILHNQLANYGMQPIGNGAPHIAILNGNIGLEEFNNQSQIFGNLFIEVLKTRNNITKTFNEKPIILVPESLELIKLDNEDHLVCIQYKTLTTDVNNFHNIFLYTMNEIYGEDFTPSEFVEKDFISSVIIGSIPADSLDSFKEFFEINKEEILKEAKLLPLEMKQIIAEYYDSSYLEFGLIDGIKPLFSIELNANTEDFKVENLSENNIESFTSTGLIENDEEYIDLGGEFLYEVATGNYC